MHGQGFAEEAGLSHEHAATLAQGTIDGPDNACPAAAFGATAMLPARQHAYISREQVGEVPAMPPVAAGPGFP